MSFQLNMPPSAVAKMAKKEEGLLEAGAETGKRREDWKKLKELEEARKAGTAPAMQDEEGKDINPHIPQYIMQAPWYFGSDTPTLRHQRPQDEKQMRYDDMNKWYKKGVKEGPIATKFRKGACENCGALTHTKKDCLERPRKVGAKFTGSDIAPDEYVQEQVDFDYEGKRDRWNGFDSEHHQHVVAEEYARIEQAKQLLKAQRLESGLAEGDSVPDAKEDEGSGAEEDEDKYAEDVDMPGQKFETKQRITVRNLRIREDTAKYLINLDPNSAYYDPKTRSMRQNPYAGTGKTDEEDMYAGDNFVRMSGDAKNMAEMQLFAWEAYEKGTDAHLQADPTKLALLSKEYKKKKHEYKHSVKQNILDKYGGEEHLEAPSKELLLSQSEHYVEYSRHGTIIKGHERAKVKSIYEEDVYLNNHSSVWGSYWRDGQWGFKCCYSVVKSSYCTGQAGQEAALEAIKFAESAAAAESGETEEPAENGDEAKPSTSMPKFNTFDVGCTTEAHKEAAKRTLEAYAKIKADAAKAEADKKKEEEGNDEEEKKKERKKKKKDKKRKRKKEMKRKKKKKRRRSSSSSDSSSSESESEEDEKAAKEKKVKEAMEREEKRVAEVERIMGLDERKRPFNSMYNDAAPTEEEIEAWRRKQKHFEDPMAHMLSK